MTKKTTIKSHRPDWTSFFCSDEHPVEVHTRWKNVDVELKNKGGDIVFRQTVEVPETWSYRAALIVAQKYFYGKDNKRESSVSQLIGRVTGTIKKWLIEQDYFSAASAEAFRNDLAYLLYNQYGSFNSPVWFNLGVPGREQQVSACFINSVQDNMESIAELQTTETLIFKRGSGSGVNLSTLRSSHEHLSNGGTASGPVSFMKGYDSWGGVVKSGGGTRRAAAIRILNIDHPDIMEYITCKTEEEKIARILIENGLDSHFDNPKGAYAYTRFQNANHSVRITDQFMAKLTAALSAPVSHDTRKQALYAVTTGECLEEIPVIKLWQAICEAAWACGDPGLQFHDTINRYNTCRNDGEINASNPCSEFVFLDDSACNLASLNLMRFRKEDGSFDIDTFEKVVEIFTIAQDALVSKADYPTEKIAANSNQYRPLGLGFSNLGAYLMSVGIPYDSDDGRLFAAAVSSLMTSRAYMTSKQLASYMGTFPAYKKNKKAMQQVIQKHIAAVPVTGAETSDVWKRAESNWDWITAIKCGFRNAQVTLLAPTGTISFMMDCETTGIEPALSLSFNKTLVGGGSIRMASKSAELALKHIGYDGLQTKIILEYMQQHRHVDNCKALHSSDAAIFDCSLPVPGENNRILTPMAHVKMLAAVQPSISGSISKTVNLPHGATIEDVSNIYYKAWDMGLKSVAIFRDGCKMSQPLNTRAKKQAPVQKSNTHFVGTRGVRRKLADHQANGHRIRFRFGETKGYIQANPYEDTGMPGEIFVQISKEGSTISGLVDGWAILVSLGLQYGIPLEAICKKFKYMKFEPSGYSTDPDIKYGHSIYDVIARKLEALFLSNGLPSESTTPEIQKAPVESFSSPPCPECGSLTIRSGACYSCPTCGSTTGCG